MASPIRLLTAFVNSDPVPRCYGAAFTGRKLARRMDVFLELQQLFPPGIVFASGPRLEAPGRRWAPASFMAAQGNEYAVLDSEALPAYFDERGLFVEYAGLHLNITRTPLTAPCLVLDEGTRSCFQLSWATTDDERP